MASQEKILTVKQHVYQIIKDDIRKGNYKPDQQINEVELSNRLNISRSPIREALRQLVSDGLAVEYPNRGVFVKKFSVEEMDNIYDFRVLIESYAISECANNLTSSMKKTLLNYKENLTKLYEAKDLENYIDEDEALHQSIVDMCNNSIIIDAYNRVNLMNKQFRIYSLLSEKRFNESIEEHIAVIDNILKGDYNEAIAVNKVHLLKAKEIVNEEITKKNNSNKTNKKASK